MFGKHHQRWLKILTSILGAVIIASMILAYFSLLL